MPYLHLDSDDVFELVDELDCCDKERLFQHLIDETNLITFNEKIEQMMPEITSVELECTDIELLAV